MHIGLDAVGSEILAIIIAALIVGISGLSHRYIKHNVVEPLRAVPQIIERQEQTATAITDIQSDVRAVMAEVYTNHGTSFRDSANRNEVLTRAIAQVVGIDPDTLVIRTPQDGPAA